MESKTENEINPLNTSEEIHKKAREELNRQLQGLLNDKPTQKFTEENIEEEVNRLMEEVDTYEKNYIPKEIDLNAFNELKQFEEEFGQAEEDEEENEKDEEDIKEVKNNVNKNSSKIKDKNNKTQNTKKEKKTKFDLDFEIEDLEDIIEKDYDSNSNKIKNKINKSESISQDKEIKDLLNEYERQLNIEVEREYEKEYKPKVDQNDEKRADALLKKDPLINEAIVQGIIKKEELILFIDYYEIFSLSNKAKKITTDHLKALDDLIIKNKKEDIDKNIYLQNIHKKNTFDLNDEDAISKLTNEIEKKLETSEDIFNKKLEYEKLIMYNNKNSINIGDKNDIKNILDKYKYKKENDTNRNVTSEKKEKSNGSNITNTTGYTNYINIKENKDNEVNNIIKNEIKKEDKTSLMTNDSESNFIFTTQELMSVPKYTLNKNKKDKKEINNNSNSTSINNKTFYKNNQDNNDLENEKEIYKPKTPLKPLSKDKNNKTNRSNISGNSNNTNSNISFNTGKKTIPPIKSNRNSINNNLKIKTNQRVDLFDDDGNILNMAKYRGARKELVKLKMGGKSKMHELFTSKPRNVEENEKLRQKFMDFIQNGKENNKNPDANSLKKSIVRKKIEDAQKFNKIKK